MVADDAPAGVIGAVVPHGPFNGVRAGCVCRVLAGFPVARVALYLVIHAGLAIQKADPGDS
jgi:hypothetical protein